MSASVLVLAVLLAAPDTTAGAEAGSAYDSRARFGVTLLGAAVGVAAPMLAGLALTPGCPTGPSCPVGMLAGGSLGIVLTGPLLAMLANRLAGGKAALGMTVASGWLALFPSMPLAGTGAILGTTGFAPNWASNTLMAAGAVAASIAIALLLQLSHRG